MAVVPLNPPGFQYCDNNGDPLALGKIYTYVAGTAYGTPKATYTDSTGNTQNANPVVLDASGRASIWVDGTYGIVVKTAADVTISSDDNVPSFAAGSVGATVTDTGFTIQNASDTTKQVQFSAASIGAGTTSTITVPDGNGTMVTTAGSQTLTNKTLTSPTITNPTITGASTVPSNSGYKTNYYYNTLGQNYYDTSTGFAVTANRLYCMPFIVSKQATFTRIGLGIIGTTASNARLGIYNMVDGLPATLSLDAGTVSTGTAGAKEITISKALSPGFYALACVFDATPSTYTGNNSSTMDIAGMLNLFHGSASAGASGNFAYYMSHTYGALPDPFVFGTAVANPTNVPVMWLRVV